MEYFAKYLAKWAHPYRLYLCTHTVKPGDIVHWIDLAGNVDMLEEHTVHSILSTNDYVRTDKTHKWIDLYQPPLRWLRIIGEIKPIAMAKEGDRWEEDDELMIKAILTR